MASTDPAADLVALNARLPTGEYLTAMWARRDLAWALPVEEVRAAHQNTLLGNVWHLANPMLSVAIYYLVFGVMLNVSSSIDNYVLWLMIGVFSFNLTTKCILGGATSISSNQGLMRSIRFPRALLPVSVIVSKLLTFGFELAVLAAVAVFTGASINSRWLLLPLVVALHSALNLGGAFIAARLNDSFRDVEQIIPFVLRLLQYLSGVMFPLGSVPRQHPERLAHDADPRQPARRRARPLPLGVPRHRRHAGGTVPPGRHHRRAPGVRVLLLPVGRVPVRAGVMTALAPSESVQTRKLTVRVTDLVLDYEVHEDRPRRAAAALRDAQGHRTQPRARPQGRVVRRRRG